MSNPKIILLPKTYTPKELLVLVAKNKGRLVHEDGLTDFVKGVGMLEDVNMMLIESNDPKLQPFEVKVYLPKTDEVQIVTDLQDGVSGVIVEVEAIMPLCRCADQKNGLAIELQGIDASSLAAVAYCKICKEQFGLLFKLEEVVKLKEE